MEWGCSLSVGTCRQLDGGVCLITLWGTDISNHDFFRMSVSDCCAGLDVVLGYFILRAVVFSVIYGICFVLPPLAVVVVPRWASGLPLLWPRWRCIPWLEWLATMAFGSPVSHFVTFGTMGIMCLAVCSASWVLLGAVGTVLAADWCCPICQCTGNSICSGLDRLGDELLWYWCWFWGHVSGGGWLIMVRIGKQWGGDKNCCISGTVGWICFKIWNSVAGGVPYHQVASYLQQWCHRVCTGVWNIPQVCLLAEKQGKIQPGVFLSVSWSDSWMSSVQHTVIQWYFPSFDGRNNVHRKASPWK